MQAWLAQSLCCETRGNHWAGAPVNSKNKPVSERQKGISRAVFHDSGFYCKARDTFLSRRHITALL